MDAEVMATFWPENSMVTPLSSRMTVAPEAACPGDPVAFRPGPARPDGDPGHIPGRPLHEHQAVGRGHHGEPGALAGKRAGGHGPAGRLSRQHLGHLHPDPADVLGVVVVDHQPEVLAHEAVHQDCPALLSCPKRSEPASPTALRTSVRSWRWPSRLTRWRTRRTSQSPASCEPIPDTSTVRRARSMTPVVSASTAADSVRLKALSRASPCATASGSTSPSTSAGDRRRSTRPPRDVLPWTWSSPLLVAFCSASDRGRKRVAETLWPPERLASTLISGASMP